MIQLITKEEFYRSISDQVKYKRKYKILELNIAPEIKGNRPIFYGLIDNTYYFSYIYVLSILMIPDIYNYEEVSSLVDSEPIISFSNWKLKKISDNTTYILNVFERVYSGICVSCKNIKKEEKGTWNLINERTNEVIEFELSNVDYFYSRASENYYKKLIAYKEKEILPVDVNYVTEKDEFLELIINGCTHNS